MIAELTVPLSTTKRIVSIVGDELDIVNLFDDALHNIIDDVSIMSFNDPVIALEHYAKNKQACALLFLI